MGNEDNMGGACIYLSLRAGRVHGAWCSGGILNVDMLVGSCGQTFGGKQPVVLLLMI
jgi:hypothetical protein